MTGRRQSGALRMQAVESRDSGRRRGSLVTPLSYSSYNVTRDGGTIQLRYSSCNQTEKQLWETDIAGEILWTKPLRQPPQNFQEHRQI